MNMLVYKWHKGTPLHAIVFLTHARTICNNVITFLPILLPYRYFGRQFDLAEETQLPLFLHMRNACSDFIGLFI